MHPKGYYLLESLSSSKSCYFESEEEARIFRVLVKRYMSKFIEIHKLYISSEGYHLIVRIRSREVLIKHYVESRVKKKKEIQALYIKEPWRIVSEQVRVLHSVYARMVNGIRNRKGVLVQKRYTRYFFESEEEYLGYIEKMESGAEVVGQKEARHRVSRKVEEQVNWVVLRWVEFVGSVVDRVFQRYVVFDLLNFTLKSHSPPP